MDTGTDQKVKAFISEAARQMPNFVRAYLFGSFAKENQKPESDIDLALVIENLADSERFDTQVKLMLLASSFDTRIEPHPISTEDISSGNPFAMEILKTGIEIKPAA